MIKLANLDTYLGDYLELKEDAQLLKILNLESNTHPIKISKLLV